MRHFQHSLRATAQGKPTGAATGQSPDVSIVGVRRFVAVAGAVLLLSVAIAAFALSSAAEAGTGVAQSGDTVPGSAAATGTFTADTPFDSGQQIDVVIPPNSVLTPGVKVFVLECAAPDGADPTTINSCDGNTGYSGGTITANSDGSVDVINSSTSSGLPYVIYALPDHVTLGEPSNNVPACGLGTANECVLYIGQGGGSDIGLSAPHFFSQPFEVHPDATDSGVLNPGDGSPQAVTAVSPTLSTVTPASQSATADGIDPATVTVTLKDQNGVDVAGKTVTLTPASGHATVAPAQSGSDVTDATGQSSFTVTDGTAESVTLDASDTTDSVGVDATAQVTFTASTVSQSASAVSADPTNVPADGTTSSTVTVSLRDSEVNGSSAPMAGKTIQLTGLSGASTIVPATSGSDVTDANGLATFSVADAVAESVVFQAKDTTDSVTLTDTASVLFGVAPSVSAATSTVVASPSPAQTGPSGTAVTVTLLASDGHTAISGKSVLLTVQSTSGHAAVVGADSVSTDASGHAQFQVTDTTAESVTITATDTTDANLVLDSKPVVVFAAPPPPTISPTISTVIISGSPAPADGFAEAVANVTVLNTNDAPVSGATVSISAAPAKTALVVAVGGINVTNSNGVVQFGVRDTTAESLTLTVTANGVTLSSKPTVQFVPGEPNANKSTVAAAPAQVAADGSTASTITVTLTDYFGNPEAGRAINLTPVSGSSVITPVQVTSGVQPGVTNAQGKAAFSVTDATTEVVAYTATETADALKLSQLVSVTFGTPPPVLPVKADSTVVTDQPSVSADGKTAATVTVELRDANGLPVTGKTVSLVPSAGSSVVAGPTPSGSVVVDTSAKAEVPKAASAVTSVTNSNGNAIFTVTDTVPESVTYTATDTTDSVGGWTVVVKFTQASAVSTSTTTTTVAAGTTSTDATDGTADTSGDAAATDTGSASDSSSATQPALAFTGAPNALPWIAGAGLVLLVLGSVGRRARLTRRREQ